MYLATKIRGNREKSLARNITWKTNADDESTEASIRQRIRDIENKLFDEYWDELLAEQHQIGAPRRNL